MTEEYSASMLKKLREMKDRFNKGREEAKKNSGGGTTLLPGQKYLTRLGKTKIVETDDGLAIIFEFTAIDGDQVGEKGVMFCGMGTDEKVGYLLRDLRKLGFEIDNLQPEQLPEIADMLNKDAPVVKIKVTEKGNFVNVYIDKLVDVGDLSGGEVGPPVEAQQSASAPAKPAPAAAAKPAPAASAAPKAPTKPAGTAAAASKPISRTLPPPERAEPQEASAAAPAAAEEVVEEVPAEEPAVEAEVFEVGGRVAYSVKGNVHNGTVKKVLPDGKGLHVADDQLGKTIAVDIERNGVSNLIETAE